MNQKKRDLIILGGGLTGLSCALTARLKGLDTLVIDRQDSPCSNGYIDELVYPHSLKKVLSDYSDYSDIFSPLVRRAFWITTPKSHIAWETVSPPDEKGLAGFVADRPAFDELLADRFQRLGGEIIWGADVEDILVDEESEKVTGISLGGEDGEISADLLIMAQCYENDHADKLSEYERPGRENYILVAKETLIGDSPSPAEKMTHNRDHAASIIILGDPLGIGFSWGRLIAYKNKLLVKIYVPFDLVGDKQDHKTFIERFKMHPSVEPVVRGFEHAGFKSSIIQSKEFNTYPEKLWGDGFLVTGKAARLYHPFDCRMTDYAIYAGTIAANAAVNASLDHRPSMPSDYPLMLKESFILNDRNSMAAFMSYMREKRNFSSVYPEIFHEITSGVFTMDQRRKSVKKADITRAVRSKESTWTIMSDFNALTKLYG